MHCDVKVSGIRQRQCGGIELNGYVWMLTGELCDQRRNVVAADAQAGTDG